jgi:hypothetical protein
MRQEWDAIACFAVVIGILVGVHTLLPWAITVMGRAA